MKHSCSLSIIYLKMHRRLLCDDILLDVLAFLHFQAIVAGDGLNTASWLLSTLISRRHPTAKKLFAKGPRMVLDNGASLEIMALRQRITDNGCLYWWIDNDDRNCNAPALGARVSGNWVNGVYLSEHRRRMPLPLVPASQEIMGMGSIYGCVPSLSFHLNNMKV
jgi:hypothetical protein